MNHPMQETAHPIDGEIRRVFSRVGLSVLAFTSGTMLASILWSELSGWLLSDYANAAWMPWASSLIPLYGVGVPAMWLSLRALPVTPHNATVNGADKPRFRLSLWLLLLILCMGLMHAGGLVGTFLMEGLSSLLHYDYVSGLEESVSASTPWITLLAACVIAPIGEEFAFRKLIIDRTRRFGDMPAILISALVFALVHGNLFQFFYAFLVGLVLAYVYTRTGNMWISVAMHAAINLIGSVILPELVALLPTDLAAYTTGHWVLLVALYVWQYGLIFLAGVILMLRRDRAVLSRGEILEDCNPLPPAFGNVGMWLGLLTLVGILLVNLLPL